MGITLGISVGTKQEPLNEEHDVTKPTWAAVVRSDTNGHKEHNKQVQAVEQVQED